MCRCHQNLRNVDFRQLLWRTQTHYLGLGGVQSKLAGLLSCLDVNDIGTEVSDGRLSVTVRCADVKLHVISILVQAESMTRASSAE